MNKELRRYVILLITAIFLFGFLNTLHLVYELQRLEEKIETIKNFKSK